MKILLYLAAGNGDLINFTGVLNVLKCKYPDYTFDFLVLRKQKSILENNPAINKVICFDEYPEIAPHCTLDGHDDSVHFVLSKQYDFIFNCWGCKIKNPSDNNYDYADVMGRLMNEYGFGIKYTRREIIPTFFYSSEDHITINSYRRPITDKIILIEDECFSAQNLQSVHNEPIFAYLKNVGYILAGNGDRFDINISQLNLKLTKLYFEECCYGFLGLSSGITCAIYAYPNFYIGKKVIVSGQTPSWNFSEILHGSKSYFYFKNNYDLQDIKSIL